MSREPDRPSPVPDEEDGAARPGAAQPEEPRTETTLTTRARISIPGSRPIPPIVVRETVDETTAQGMPAVSARGANDPGKQAGAAAGEKAGKAGKDERGEGKKTSSWFEPRKPVRGSKSGSNSGAGGPGDTPPAGTPAAGTPAPGGPAAGTPATGASATGASPTGTPPSGTPAADTPAEGTPGIRRPAPYGPAPGARPAPPPGRRGTPRGPGETSSGGIPGLGRSAPSWFQSADDRRDTPPDGSPAASEDDLPPAPTPQLAPSPPLGAPTPPHGISSIGPISPRGPEGPTTGPGSGSMPVPPPPGDELAATTMDLGGPFPPAPPPGRLDSATPTAAGPSGAAPQATPAADEDDGPTEPGPTVTVDDNDEETEALTPDAPDPSAGRRRRGRLRLAVLALVGVGVVAYGAGLLLNSDDVPSGTTVLGVDIGGTTAQEATNRLDAALERANNDPLTLRIDGQEAEVLPEVAGLAVDTEATVNSVSGQDYNPVTVIGSLFGAERTREAVFAVDREKLTVALEDVGREHAGDRAPVEGEVTFEAGLDGRAIGHPGEPGLGIDVDAAADAVTAAFRERAESGTDQPVELPLTEQQPLVDAEEVERAMKEFAEPAMSGWLEVVAGDAPPLPFSDETLAGLLSMEPSENGTLQPVIDTEALAEAYGSHFDGVKIDAGSGLVDLTPEHVAAAMIPVLREPAPDDEGIERRQVVVEGAVGGG